MPPWPEMPLPFIDWLVKTLMKLGYRQVQCPTCSVFYFKPRMELERDVSELKELHRISGYRAFDADI